MNAHGMPEVGTPEFLEWARDRAGCKRSDSGARLCAGCEVELREELGYCAECTRKADEKRAQEECDRLERERVASVHAKAARGLAGTPDFPHGRIGSPDFATKCRSRKLQNFAAQYKSERGSVAALGASGVGKTTACVALIHRLVQEGIAAGISSGERPCMMQVSGRYRAVLRPTPGVPALDFAAGIVWVTARELVLVRRNSPLGEEPDLLAKCTRASLLFIDEWGSEPADRDGDLFAVVDARYAAGLPIIITSGLTSKAFDERYGTALLRRIVERGAKIEEFGGGS